MILLTIIYGNYFSLWLYQNLLRIIQIYLFIKNLSKIYTKIFLSVEYKMNSTLLLLLHTHTHTCAYERVLAGNPTVSRRLSCIDASASRERESREIIPFKR